LRCDSTTGGKGRNRGHSARVVNSARARAHARRRTLSSATSSPPYPDRTRTPRRRKTPRSEASTIATVDISLMTRASSLGQGHAASPHSLAGEPPFTIGRRFCRTSPPPPRPCRCSCRSRRSGETASTRRRAYKTLPLLSSRVHEPPLQSAAAGELLDPLAPWPTDDPKLHPSPHLSSHACVMA
jgi:hypothetical protein